MVYGNENVLYFWINRKTFLPSAIAERLTPTLTFSDLQPLGNREFYRLELSPPRPNRFSSLRVLRIRKFILRSMRLSRVSQQPVSESYARCVCTEARNLARRKAERR